jgi:hypothetical protein
VRETEGGWRRQGRAQDCGSWRGLAHVVDHHWSCTHGSGFHVVAERHTHDLCAPLRVREFTYSLAGGDMKFSHCQTAASIRRRCKSRCKLQTRWGLALADAQ